MARKNRATDTSAAGVDGTVKVDVEGAGAGPGPIAEASVADTAAGDLGQGTAPVQEAPKVVAKNPRRRVQNPVIDEKSNPLITVVAGDRRRQCRKEDLPYFKARGFKLAE